MGSKPLSIRARYFRKDTVCKINVNYFHKHNFSSTTDDKTSDKLCHHYPIFCTLQPQIVSNKNCYLFIFVITISVTINFVAKVVKYWKARVLWNFNRVRSFVDSKIWECSFKQMTILNIIVAQRQMTVTKHLITSVITTRFFAPVQASGFTSLFFPKKFGTTMMMHFFSFIDKQFAQEIWDIDDDALLSQDGEKRGPWF